MKPLTLCTVTAGLFFPTNVEEFTHVRQVWNQTHSDSQNMGLTFPTAGGSVKDETGISFIEAWETESPSFQNAVITVRYWFLEQSRWLCHADSKAPRLIRQRNLRSYPFAGMSHV